MCGSGTLPIEAALIAADIAPGLLRDSASIGASPAGSGTTAAWRRLLARRASDAGRPGAARASGNLIRGSTATPRRCAPPRPMPSAPACPGIRFERRPRRLPPRTGATPGLVVTNPPYGERLGGDSQLPALYALLGGVLRERFDGWRAACFTGNPDLGKGMGLRASASTPSTTAPSNAGCCTSRSAPRPMSRTARARCRPAERGPGAEMLANRLRKNQKGLKKWLRAEGISCYRLYDADLPEYALAIDIYGSADPRDQAKERRFVHVQEYAPRQVDPRDAAPAPARGHRRHPGGAGGAGAGPVLQGPPATAGTAQYERLADSGRFHEVARTACGCWSTSRTIWTPACSWTIARPAA
jgi:23S rRNA (guanine2445-N2)-methyltransferase / 23S rRNA (guanine2069-N7)-methyltransferase